MSDEIPVRPILASTECRLRLLECIEQNVESLLGSISLYARRMRLDGEADARGMAVEILQETVVEALDHADSFTATRQPVAWLLGIAVNVIRRKKVEQAKHARREISLGLLAAHASRSGGAAPGGAGRPRARNARSALGYPSGDRSYATASRAAPPAVGMV